MDPGVRAGLKEQDARHAAPTPTPEADFERLVAPHRAELHAHCYRMLGSVHDAEDALQETLLRAWRACRASRAAARCARGCTGSPPTSACALIERRPQRRAPGRPGPPSDDPRRRPAARRARVDRAVSRRGDRRRRASPEARYEQRESVELAFIAALQHLPGAPARGAAAARRARLLARGDRRGARHDGRVGLQRAAARARGGRGAAARRAASRRRCARSATGGCASSSSATSARGSTATSTRSSGMLADDATFAMPPTPDLVPRPRRRRRVPRRLAALAAAALAARAGRAPTASSRFAMYARRRPRPVRAPRDRGADARRRRAGHRGRRVPRPGVVDPARAPGRDGA